MFFGKAVRQERIANGAGEWNVHCSAQMHVSEFAVSGSHMGDVTVYPATAPISHMTAADIYRN